MNDTRPAQMTVDEARAEADACPNSGDPDHAWHDHACGDCGRRLDPPLCTYTEARKMDPAPIKGHEDCWK